MPLNSGMWPAFMQADIDKLIHVHLDGDLSQLLLKVDPSYKKFLSFEWNMPVIYAELDKAFYGTLQAALVFWWKPENNHCIVNKEIKGSQCTIRWHVDDI